MAAGRTTTRRSATPIASWAVVVQDFAWAWLGYAILAIIISGITQGIFHIALWQVVDVILALFLFHVAFVGSLSAIAFFLDLAGGEVIVSLSRVISILMLPFLPIGAILGFLAYGFFVEESFASSFVYQGFVDLFRQGYELIAGGAGDFLGVLKPAEHGGLQADTGRLVFVAQVASVLLAAAGFGLARSRVIFVADDTLRFSPFSVVRR